MGHLHIIIPFYNEEKKFAHADYARFLQEYPDVRLCLVNDGSKDQTLTKLQQLQEEFSSQIHLIDLKKNGGKAAAVRAGMLHSCTNDKAEILAYVDADLAVSLEECYEMRQYIGQYDFCFGSRILRVGAKIERKFSRFLIGRIVATFISKILDLKVYDTQCGCKLFKKELAQQIFQEEFISKWLFDVEIFFRMYQIYGKENAISKMLEIPLKQWIDKGDSKVKMSYFFKLFLDLSTIRKRYKSLLKPPLK